MKQIKQRLPRKTRPRCSAVIQATHYSPLFPGKSLSFVAGDSVLGHIVRRVRMMPSVAELFLATSDRPEDIGLAAEAKRLGMKVIRGSRSDLISRLSDAAEQASAGALLKINGNYPLVDPYLAEELLKSHLAGRFDFSYNEHVDGTIHGTGCEVIRRELLLETRERPLTIEQRESGTLYFFQNGSGLKVNRRPYKQPRPEYKVAFDTDKDLRLIEFIFKQLPKPFTQEIIELLDNNPLLAESNRWESVKEVGLEKLHLFPDKVAAIQNVQPSGVDLTYPVSVELSLTNRCNQNCVWCSDRRIRRTFNGDLDVDVAKRLLDDLKAGGTRGIVLEGGGEPTLHPHFDDIVAYAHDQGFGVGLITNGSTPLREDVMGKLEWVRVSLDSANADQHKRLKGRANFESVMSNIKALRKAVPTVGVGYVVTSKNVDNLEVLLLRLTNLGVDYIQFRPVIDHPDLDATQNLTYLKRYENSRFSVITDGMQENVLEGNVHLPCLAHSLTSVIAADGQVFLCGRLNIYPWFKAMGNINSQAFREIWLGNARLEQAKQVRDPEFCVKHCPRCRITKFNQLLDRLEKVKTRHFL